MNTPTIASVSGCRLTPLAACIVTLFGISLAPTALATNRPVTSCLDDNDPGTLRNVIAAAVSGDTVDLTTLSCPSSKITLATGGQHIAIYQTNLVIKGPGAAQLTIDGSQLETYYKNYSNVFYHKGTGTLRVKYLTVSGGHQSHKNVDSLGGCVYSAGSVVLSGSTITQCSAYSQQVSAKGGAIYAKGNVKSYFSAITGNSAQGGSVTTGGGVFAKGDAYFLGSDVSSNEVSSGAAVFGGGVFAIGDMTVYASTVTGNSATSTNNSTARGGGAEVQGAFISGYSTISGNSVSSQGAAGGGGLSLFGSTTIANTTISGNSSSGGYAGINAFSVTPGTKTFLMRNSTISANHAASLEGGGAYVNSGTTKIYNSTIAFNTSQLGSPGLVISANFGAVAATLQSNLMTDNSWQGYESDLDVVNSAVLTFNAGPANNLIRVANTGSAQLPADTISTTCVPLGPLRDNGGLTKTHAPASGSAAIDAGNSILIDPKTNQPYAFDQRGSADGNGTLDYLRSSGPQADIGAHEVQQLDVVFNSGFDGCLALIM